MYSNSKKVRDAERKENFLMVVYLALFVAAIVYLFIWASSMEPAYCRQMRGLNPDWQFHYSDTTGCRVLYQGFWILVDDLPEALRGGE